jgi:hypothetical protein
MKSSLLLAIFITGSLKSRDSERVLYIDGGGCGFDCLALGSGRYDFFMAGQK